ncbi:MAG: hypothetical protein MMC33_009806 [Icmadophila ericetorum]|nr:hypothetical protein [Icmadophila ericetorum]
MIFWDISCQAVPNSLLDGTSHSKLFTVPASTASAVSPTTVHPNNAKHANTPANTSPPTTLQVRNTNKSMTPAKIAKRKADENAWKRKKKAKASGTQSEEKMINDGILDCCAKMRRDAHELIGSRILTREEEKRYRDMSTKKYVKNILTCDLEVKKTLLAGLNVLYGKEHEVVGLLPTGRNDHEEAPATVKSSMASPSEDLDTVEYNETSIAKGSLTMAVLNGGRDHTLQDGEDAVDREETEPTTPSVCQDVSAIFAILTAALSLHIRATKDQLD